MSVEYDTEMSLGRDYASDLRHVIEKIPADMAQVRLAEAVLDYGYQAVFQGSEERERMGELFLQEFKNSGREKVGKQLKIEIDTLANNLNDLLAPDGPSAFSFPRPPQVLRV
jgi:uncharacterized protein YPO0396